jgi:hypothetical protein
MKHRHSITVSYIVPVKCCFQCLNQLISEPEYMRVVVPARVDSPQNLVQLREY